MDAGTLASPGHRPGMASHWPEARRLQRGRRKRLPEPGELIGEFEMTFLQNRPSADHQDTLTRFAGPRRKMPA
jgi:hypothetical protein